MTLTMTFCTIKMALYNLHNDSAHPHSDLCARTITCMTFRVNLCALTDAITITRYASTVTMCAFTMTVNPAQ